MGMCVIHYLGVGILWGLVYIAPPRVRFRVAFISIRSDGMG